MPEIFTGYGIIFVVAALLTVGDLVTHWRQFWDGPLSREEETRAWRLALFVFVPLAVLAHEYGHVLAIASVGGRTVTLYWGIYWGYVIPEGVSGTIANWWVAAAGSVASMVLAGVLIALALRVRRFSPALRFTFASCALTTFIHTLVFYPLISSSIEGDWSTIYDFRATPVASAVAALTHAAVVGGMVWWWRRGGLRERIVAISRDLEPELDAVAANRDDPKRRIALAERYYENDRVDLARETIRKAVRAQGEQPDLYAALGTYSWHDEDYESALVAYRRAQELGATGERRRSLIRGEALALRQLHRDDEALRVFDALPGIETDWDSRYWRGTVRERVGQRDLAIEDFRAIERGAPTGSDPARWARDALARLVPNHDLSFRIRAPLAWLGPGKLVENAVVVIEGGRVTFAGPPTEVAAEPAGEEIMVDGFLMPGVVDRHVHIGLSDPASVVRGGVTAVRDLGWPPETIFALADASERPGFAGPLIRCVGPMITCPDGYPTRSGWAPPGTGKEVRGPEEAAAVARELLARGAAALKVALNSEAGPTLSDEELRAVCDVAHGARKTVTAHAQGRGEVERALNGGVDEFAHCPWSERLSDEAIAAMTQKTRIVSTLDIHSYGRDTPELEIALDNLSRFFEAGGSVAYGTDLGNGPIPPGIHLSEVRHLRRAGLSPEQVLEALTSRPLAPGEPADLIGLSGNPLQDLNALNDVRLVVRAGRRIR